MSPATVSIKDFKQIIKDHILDKLNGIGIKDLNDNPVKTGYFFSEWVADLIIDSDGGYELYYDIPEVKDKGVDFVLIDRSSRNVLLAQCKSRSLNSTSSPNSKREDVLGFWGIHKQLMKDDYLADATEDTVRLLEEYKLWVDQNYKITWRYITLEKKPPELENEVLHLSGREKDTFIQEMWGISELKDYYREAVALSDKPPEEVQFSLKSNSFYEKKPIKSAENVSRAIIGNISGNELANLYRQSKSSLFAYNIRQFLGKPNNKNIIETAKERPDQFFYFNNGITCICSSYKRTDNKIVAKDFQVINGAQTVGSIKAASESGNIKDLEIMIRVIETGDISSTQKGFNRDIVTYNNTQNRVETWDFISNDDIQQYLSKFLINDNPNAGYKFRYQRKRVDRIKQGYKKVTPELLAKILYSMNEEDFHPNIPSAEGKGKLVQPSTQEGGLYDVLFKTELNKWPNEYLDSAFVGIEIYYKLDTYFRALDKDNKLKKIQAPALKFMQIALFKSVLDSKGINISKCRKNPDLLQSEYDENMTVIIKLMDAALSKAQKDFDGTNLFRYFSRSKEEYDALKDQVNILVNK